MRNRLVLLALVLAGTLGPIRPVAAQMSRTDSATALLRSARVLDAEGAGDLAREVYRFLLDRFGDTPAAAEARAAMTAAGEPAIRGLSRTGFIAYHTFYGTFLGIAVPAALGADSDAPYGVGLLVGAPTGFFASRAYAASRPLTEGQAGLIEFGSLWGTWQAIGWRAVFEIGNRTECVDSFCYDLESDTAPWVAGILGGLTGLGVGLAVASRPVTETTATLISNSAGWGSWYGLAAAMILDAEEDWVVAATLIGGNLGLLAAIPAARGWNPPPERIRTISAAGAAGGVAGLGVLLLVTGEDTQAAFGILSAGVTVGLVTGTILTRNTPNPSRQVTTRSHPSGALVQFGDGVRFGLPAPVPTLVPTPDGARKLWAPGIRVSLLDARF